MCGSNSRDRILFLLCFCFCSVALAEIRIAKVSHLRGDCYGSYWVVRSIVEDFDFNLKNQLENAKIGPADQMALGHLGEWYPLHEIGMSLLGIPLYLLLGKGGLLITNFIVYGFFLYLIFDLAWELSSAKAAAIACLIVLFSDPSLLFSFSIEVLGVCVVLLSIWLLRRGDVAFSGFVFSSLVFCRLAFLATLPAFISYLAIATWQKHGNTYNSFKHFIIRCGIFGLAMLPVVLGYFMLNWIWFDELFTTSYNHWAIESAGSLHKKNQADILFSRPLVDGLGLLLFNQEDGLFVKQPALLLAIIFGISPFFKKNLAEASFILIATAALLILFAGYPGIDYSPGRYLLLIQTMMIIPLSVALKIFLGLSDIEKSQIR